MASLVSFSPFDKMVIPTQKVVRLSEGKASPTVKRVVDGCAGYPLYYRGFEQKVLKVRAGRATSNSETGDEQRRHHGPRAA